MTKSEIFTAAWELAERGATDFGGSKKNTLQKRLKLYTPTTLKWHL